MPNGHIRNIVRWLAILGAFATVIIFFERIRSDLAAVKETANKVLEVVEDVQGKMNSDLEGKQTLGDPAVPRSIGSSGADSAQDFVRGFAVVLRPSDETTACGLQSSPKSEYAAHPTLACGSELRVTNVVTALSGRFRVMERAGNRTSWRMIRLALSPAAAKKIGLAERGVIEYRVESEGPPI